MRSRCGVPVLASIFALALAAACDRSRQDAERAPPSTAPERVAPTWAGPEYLDPTGLYRTSVALPGHEDVVGADQLVHLRFDGEFAPASVLMPAANEHNKWRFELPGIKLPRADDAWVKTLRRVPHEGFYRLTRGYRFGTDGRWMANAIVQLGYARDASPLIFIAQRRQQLAENDLRFSDRGVKLGLDELDDLIAPLTWYEGPEAP